MPPALLGRGNETARIYYLCRQYRRGLAARRTRAASLGNAAMSALPPKADIRRRECDVRFVPKADIRSPYPITSSARARRDGGTARPSALAVLRLITSSYLVGACTGMSAGFSPLRMRST